METIQSQDIHRQAVGIDVSAETLQAQLGLSKADRELSYSQSHTFPNSEDGYRQLTKWVRSKGGDLQECWFVMEATGVYYEQLAYRLHQAGRKVCVLVASRAYHWAQSLPIKSKTDRIDARLLARYGLERRPRRWQPGSGRLREIKLLLREREQLQAQRTQLKNRLHAARQSWNHPASSLRRLQEHIEQINAYITQIDRQVEELWQSDQALSEPIRRIGQITGLGRESVLKVVAETNGFALIRNRNQLASYAGLDVALDQSGTRQGKAHISKQGNVHLRRALYMPAVCASQHNRALQVFYQRLVAKHPDHKKIALTALMRKLLLLIYSLWKSGEQYDEEFHYQQITKAA